MGIRIRPYRDSDATTVFDLLSDAHSLDDTLEPPSTVGAWRAFVSRSFNHGGRDFALATLEGAPAGVLTSTRLGTEGEEVRHIRILVHPTYRRRGLATRLHEHAEAQDADGIALQSNCPGAWRAGEALLRRMGYEPGRRVLKMCREHAPAPRNAKGPAIRPLRKAPDDDRAWLRLHEIGYAGQPDYSPLTEDDLATFRAEEGFALWFAEVDGAPVGLCHVVRYANRIYVNSLVVDPAHRRQGVGRALMLHAIERHQRENPDPLHLTVDADNPARHLYAALGFETIDTITTWRRYRRSGT